MVDNEFRDLPNGFSRTPACICRGEKNNLYDYQSPMKLLWNLECTNRVRGTEVFSRGTSLGKPGEGHAVSGLCRPSRPSGFSGDVYKSGVKSPRQLR